MTLQSFQPIPMPDPQQYGNIITGSIAYGSLLIDAAAEKGAFVFRAPKAGTLARVGFRTAVVTTGDTLKVSFQDVSLANGDPDGTPDQFRTVAVADTDDNIWIRTGLVTSDGTDTGAKRTVTQGELLSVVIEFDSFVAGNLNLAMRGGGPVLGVSYVDHFTAAWAKQTGAINVAVIAVEYDDGTFAAIPNTCPTDTAVVTTITNATTPDEVALRFSVPFKCKVHDFWGMVTPSADTDIVLYDSDGATSLGTVTLDKDVKTGATDTYAAAPFAADITLTPGTFYRLAVKPSGASARVLTVTVPATPGAAQWDQFSMGQNFHWSERTDAGVWTNTTTKRPVMGLYVSALDDGAGTGGGGAPVIHRGRGREVR